MFNRNEFHLFNNNNQSFCDKKSLNNEIYCQNNSGLYCQIYPSYLYTIQHSSYEDCTNAVISELCPARYYCNLGYITIIKNIFYIMNTKILNSSFII